MEKDREFMSAQKWYEPADRDERLALEYLKDLVRSIFMETQGGIKLADVPKFLEDNGFTLDMVIAVGFYSLQHFLFHLDSILEIRGKKINGRISYYAFIKESLMKRSVSRRLLLNQGGSNAVVFHHSTFPAEFSKILNLHRGSICTFEYSDDNEISEKIPGINREAPKHTSEENRKEVPKAREHTYVQRNPIPISSNSSSHGSGSEEVVRVLRTHVFDEPDPPQFRHHIRFLGFKDHPQERSTERQ